MKKKLLAALLTLALVASLFAGCGGGPGEEGGSENKGSENVGGSEDTESEIQDIADVTLSFWSLGTVPTEEAVEKVENAINAILEPEIGVRLNLNIMDVGSYIPDGKMANGVANGEDFDVVCTAAALSGHFSNMYANDMLIEMNDLLDEYGQEMVEMLPDDWFAATTINGKIYGVPTYANKAKSMYWVVRNEVIEAAGLDLSKIKTIDDVEAALIKIKEACPEYNAIGGASQTLDILYPGWTGFTEEGLFDTLGDSTGVAASVFFDGDDLKAVSRYEDPRSLAVLKQIQKWNEMGLVDPETATDKANATPFDNAKTASGIYVGQEDVALQRNATYNTSFVKLVGGVIGTANMQQFTWAIPTSCDEPEAAMKFINYAYTSEEVTNLLNYGIEGEHYVWDEATGTVGFPEGVTADTSEYYLGAPKALLGNAFLAYPWTGAPVNASELGLKDMESAVYSPLLGFTLDTAKLGDNWSNIGTICKDEYCPFLFTGQFTDEIYDEFIAKIYAAGLEECLAEINAQIDAWLAENK